MASYNKIILLAFMILPLFTGSLAVGGLQTAYGGDVGECVGQTAGTACGDQSMGACDNPDTCDGEGNCKSNFKSSITLCRPQAGICDEVETCTGNSAVCPDDEFIMVGTVCRPSAGVCDVEETCTGNSAVCPDDGFSTDSCRASTGVCDVEEFCDGSSASCPDDAFADAGTACSCSAGSGTCDGNNMCIKNISIDIKPGSDPNSINTGSMGLVPVAILGSATFAVAQVDETTLMFGTASPAHDLSDPTTYNEHIQDVNDDGFDDLVSHYKQKDTGIMCGDTEATLTGVLLDGTPIGGTDSVNPKCKP